MKTVKLGEIAAVDRCSVDPSALDPSTPYVGLEHIERGGRIRTSPTVGEAGLKSSKFRFTEEHILFGKLRPNLCKVADPPFSGVCSTDILPVRVSSVIDKSYLKNFLRWGATVDEVTRLASGANLPRISPTALGGVSVPLPDIEDQRRIAAILDRVDAQRSRRRAHVDYLEVLIRSRLAAVVAHAPTGPALGDVAGFVRGVTFKPADVSNEGVPVMRTKNVQKRLDLSDVIRIPADLVRNEDKYLRPGDTLVSSANSYNLVGKCCFVGELSERSAIGGFVAALRPGPDVDPMFLYHWFNSDRIQETVRSFGNQTTNISNLNIKRTLTLRLPDVSLSVQREFAAVVAKVDEQRERIERALALEDELFASLQYRAFRGEL